MTVLGQIPYELGLGASTLGPATLGIADAHGGLEELAIASATG